MSMSWDDDDFEPAPAPAPIKKSDKWDGEDEEVSTKDNWDDEDDIPTASEVLPEKKKKKKLADVIAEKEQKQLEEKLKRKQQRLDQEAKETPSEKTAEKLRLQKIQEDSDLALVSDMMDGLVGEEEEETISLDNIELASKGALESFRETMVAKFRSTDRLEMKSYYISFVEDLTRDLCQNLGSDAVKRITTSLNTVYNEKVKASKPVKGKKKGSKAKLNLGQGAITDELAEDGNFDDDYFM